MIIIAAVDEENGLMFNNRRQSQDRILRERILSMSFGSKLWMNQYSKNQFNGCNSQWICESEDFLDEATDGEYCFVENTDVSLYENEAEKIILFRWNRKYPSDFYFDIDVNSLTWHLTYIEDFQGYSHEKITMEVYER